MERRLHPDFISNTTISDGSSKNENRIQTEFDPTPQSLKKEASSIATSTEFETDTKLRIGRLNQKVSMIEKRLDQYIQESHINISKISSRVNEKGLQETKVESLIERHNQVLLSFEKRMSQLAKYIEEKDAHILLLQGQLEESRKELFRLKRL